MKLMIATKITKSQYDDLKNSYLAKNRSMHSLYIEIYEKANVDKHSFFRLINRIREEEGLKPYYTKKEKIRKEIIENLDKSTNHYNQ